MLAHVGLFLLLVGAHSDSVEPQCQQVGLGTEGDLGIDSECLGDKYRMIQDQTVLECADECEKDPQCIQWTHEPPHANIHSKAAFNSLCGFLCSLGAFCNVCERSGTCYLSSTRGGVSHPSYGSCCGHKKGPLPTPAPAPAPVPGAQHHWAVIIAGSNTYTNYRHQADACHAYQIAKKNGIPESNIILLAYDDIANNAQNPIKGKMFNKPNGPDVYEGCKISYKGAQVNKDNFLKVLTGDTSAPGPVLRSTSKDRVFVYYADHGGVGILGVPNGAAGGYIHASDVNAALAQMHAKGMFAELLFYVEACESGSIFKDLLTAPNVLAVTAANADESSWGFYCPPLDKVSGKSMGTCLGDEFSIRWMEDADVSNFKTRTVRQEIDTVTTSVKKSHVQQYGDISAIGAEVLGDFMGAEAISPNVSASLAYSEDSSKSAVNSRDIEVHLAYYRMERAQTLQQKRAVQTQLATVLARRQAADEKFMQIALLAMDGDKAKAQDMINGHLESIVNVYCHFHSLQIAAEKCGAFDDYTMRYSRLFANLCDAISMPLPQISHAVEKVCSPTTNVVV